MKHVISLCAAVLAVTACEPSSGDGAVLVVDNVLCASGTLPTDLGTAQLNVPADRPLRVQLDGVAGPVSPLEATLSGDPAFSVRPTFDVEGATIVPLRVQSAVQSTITGTLLLFAPNNAASCELELTINVT